MNCAHSFVDRYLAAKASCPCCMRDAATVSAQRIASLLADLRTLHDDAQAKIALIGDFNWLAKCEEKAA